MAVAQLVRSLALRQVSFAALLGGFAVVEVFLFLLRSGLLLEYPQFFGIQLVAGSFLGPLMYCYFASTLDASFLLRRRDALHLIPALVILVALVPFWRIPVAEKKAVVSGILATGEPVAVRLAGVAICAGILGYLARAANRLMRSKSDAPHAQNLAIPFFLLSLWFLAICLAGFAISRGYFTLLAITGITLTLSLIAIFFLGQRYPHVLQHALPRATRYQKSTTAGLNLSAVLARLDALFKIERLYRDPNVTLKSLSASSKKQPAFGSNGRVMILNPIKKI